MKIFIDPGHAWDKRGVGARATGEPLSPAAILPKRGAKWQNSFQKNLSGGRAIR